MLFKQSIQNSEPNIKLKEASHAWKSRKATNANEFESPYLVTFVPLDKFCIYGVAVACCTGGRLILRFI